MLMDRLITNMLSISPFSTTPFSSLADSFLEAGARIEALSLFDTDSKIRYQIGGLLEAISQTDLSSKIKFYQIANPIEVTSAVSGDSKILLFANSSMEVETLFSSEYLARTIGISDLITNSTFDVDSYIKILDSISIDTQTSLDALLGARYSNQANLEIMGILSSNLSQRNRDIVYYILAINQKTPFELKILRTQ